MLTCSIGTLLLLLLATTALAGISSRSGIAGPIEEFALPFAPTQRRFSLILEEENRLGDIVFRVVPSPESGVPAFSRIDIAPNSTGAGYFVVSNASAGEIRLARLLDYEFAHTLDIDVRAWLAPPDPGSVGSSALVAPMAHALVGVQIVNINDHQPVFDAPKDPLTRELYAQVSENAPPGTLVAQLHATDTDTGKVGEMRYIIVGVAPGTPMGFGDAFGVEPVDGALRVINSTLLDHESIQEVDLLVAAVDNPNRFDRQYAAINRLTISLIDQNDNAPKFNASSFRASEPVCECAQPGYLVAAVTATDLDESSTNQLTYRLVDANVSFTSDVPASLLRTDPRTLFAVDRSTGQVTVIVESLESLIGNYSLLVEVADQGGLTARSWLFFNVSSDNRFAPEFTVPERSWTEEASIMENRPADTLIFNVTARDLDTFAGNKVVEFYFYDESTNSLVSVLPSGFHIDKMNGAIHSTRSFDAEADPAVFKLPVVARDNGTPPKQANHTLLVRLLDQDEFSPHWRAMPTDGCNMQFDFRIPERSPIGGRVGRVWSQDDDRTNRSYFRLEARNDAKYFHIDPTTGVITIANPEPSDYATTTPGQEVTASFLDFEDKEHKDFVLFVSVSPLATPGTEMLASTPPAANAGSPSATPTGCMRGNVARVYIHLTNMEDASPVFGRGQKPYYYCVAGNAVKNTLVSSLPPMTATDLDNSRLTFRMPSTQWRSSAGFVSVSCAFHLQQAALAHSGADPTAQLLVNSALGNYTRSYFRIPVDVRDQSGLSSSTYAYVWVTPPEEGTSASTDLSFGSSSVGNSEVILPTPPPEKSTYYATVTVAENYDVFMTKLNEWVDCVSEKLLAGDELLAGAALCIANVAPGRNDPNGMTEVRLAAASRSDMLLTPAVLLVSALQRHLNETGGGLCGVIGATCYGCGTGISSTIVTGQYLSSAAGFDPLALLIALAVLLLFLILLLLILLAICCRARRKAPILVPAPPPPPVVPVFAVKPARLYETQEAYMTVDNQLKEMEEQEVHLDECEEEESEEVFEIPLPREYETQTVLMEMPNWQRARDYGHDNATLVLDHDQPIPLTRQHGARHLSGSVYSEPYFRSAHSEQRAFSMLHIDTRPGPVLQQPIARHSQSQSRRHCPPTSDMSPPPSQRGSRAVMTLPPPALTPPTNSSVTGRSSRAGTPSLTNLPGASSHIARRIGEASPTPYQNQPMRSMSPRPVVGGLLRPAISADSITLMSQQQQARRAVLQQQQQLDDQPDGIRFGPGGRTDESEPSEADDPMRRHSHHHPMLDDDEFRGGPGSGRLRRTRSLPKYLQPPAELQSVMAELHDYIKSPEQKARRRRISQKYRAKILASGGGATLGNQTGQTSSSSGSLEHDQSSQSQYQQQSMSQQPSYGAPRNGMGNQNGNRRDQQRDYMML